MTVISPGALAEVVRTRLRDSSFTIAAFWIQVTEDRAQYATDLRAALVDDPIAVLIVREPTFDNANAVLMDLVRLIDANREDCQTELAGPTTTRCGMVLLARNELSVPQASSPVTLPEWFPVGGGEIVYTQIEDVTWTADIPLDGPEVRVGEICAHVHALEGEMLARLDEVQARDHRLSNAFFDLVRRDGDGPYAEVLRRWAVGHAAVHNPTGFRPSVRDGTSLVARLWGLMQATTPDKVPRAASQLSCALDLENVEAIGVTAYEPLLAAIARPAGDIESAGAAICRSLLVSMASACRVITVAAHADAYPGYPVPLLRSLSHDLRRGLVGAEQAIERARQEES